MYDLKKDIISYLRDKEDPTGIRNILKAIGLHKSDRQLVRDILEELVQQGEITKQGSKFWVPSGKEQALTIKRAKSKAKREAVGRLMLHPRGFGFVDVGDKKDWFLPRHATGNAGNGDIVRVERMGQDENGRVTAKLLAIEGFGAELLVGVFQEGKRGMLFTPFGNEPAPKQTMKGYPGQVPAGSVAVWRRDAQGDWRFDRLLGRIDDPEVDETVALIENKLETGFPDKILKTLAWLTPDFQFDPQGRTDFRDKLVFTIDGETAKDFDDALHFEPLADGGLEVGVHIADVSHFVKEDSPLDRLAADRGNSIYFPHKAFPMLPPILSEELCSLKPHVPRYTLSLLATFAKGGKLKGFKIHKGLICSNARLTYDQVFKAAVERDEATRTQLNNPELLESLDLGLELAALLQDNRRENGGLTLALGEAKIGLDEDLAVMDVDYVYQNEAHRLIESYMCFANECVAEWFSELGISIPYRVHEAPDPVKLQQFGDFMAAQGIDVPLDLETDPATGLNRIIEQIKERDNARTLQYLVLRTLKLASYSPVNVGHFGLASAKYAHFTSPIRRYADLKLHQRLTALLAQPGLGPEHFDDEQLETVCAHISQKERDAMNAERTFVKMKMLRHLQDEVGSTFHGTVTGVKAFGLFVVLDEVYVDGLISIDNLADDDYEYNEEAISLVGRKKGSRYTLGDRVEVRIDRIDLISRTIDLGLLEQEPHQQALAARRLRNLRARPGKGGAEKSRGKKPGFRKPGGRPAAKKGKGAGKRKK